ncbi:MAG: ABC transporter ATP-binding protein, partial [Hadesarchaea archaeon]|nr:ABC transporter ATP-binding protein [Hadesarchaea archaeon]
EKYPHELSGGMKQRSVIAMALACNPKLLIADEPTSSIDVSIQARILDLLNDLKEEYGLSILYITHDLGVVAQVCDRAAIMYGGGLVEIADVKELFKNPLHPYTKLLLEAVPSPEKEELRSIKGSVPNLITPPEGCRFHPRCPYAKEKCSEEVPSLVEVKEGHLVSCHYWEEIKNENTS